MKGSAIVLDSVPIDVEALKERAPNSAGIEGTSVYQAEFVRSLLRFGTQDSLYFLNAGTVSESSVAKEFTSWKGNTAVHVLRPGTIASLELPPKVLFFTGGPDISRFAPLRRYLCRPQSPIAGITHSLNGHTLPLALSMLLTEGHAPFDALICTTRSAQSVVRAYLASMSDRLGLGNSPSLHFDIRLPIIPLGINSDASKTWRRDEARARFGFADDRVVILYLGRLSTLTKTDLRPLLRVFAEFRKHWTKETLLILAGDDSRYHLRESLESIAAGLGCAEHLLVKPDLSRDEKFALLAAADLFIAPSDNIQETFGIGVAEAMAAGLPVVAADWDGYRDLVDHGETGLLIPTYYIGANSDVDAYCAISPVLAERLLAQTTVIDCAELGKALTALVENLELRRRFGSRAKEVARLRFDWRVVIGAYEDLWQELFQLGKAISHESPGPLSPKTLALGTFRIRALFEAYASATIHLDDSFCLETVGHNGWSHLCRSLRILKDDGILSKSQLERIVKELESQPSSVRLLALKLAMSEADALLHVARLWKFGVVSRIAPTLQT
jgi:D-inositol-3-phosphate glycosyltransferase